MAGTELGQGDEVQIKEPVSEQVEAKPLTEKEMATQQLLGEFLQTAPNDSKSKCSDDQQFEDTAKRPLGSVKEIGFPTVTIEDDKTQSERYQRDRETRDWRKEPVGEVKNPLGPPLPYYPAPSGYGVPMGLEEKTKK